MNLKEYIAGSKRGTAKRLAESLGISQSYLSQMAAGQSPISQERCFVIEQVTSGMVMRWDLKPSNWHKLWPELAGAPGSPPIPLTAGEAVRGEPGQRAPAKEAA
ncbi:transcriptional regulator [Paraburkholderia sp. UCT2]|uniref:transcriptional regulator n=1 Tax=Paraburkholderia sp. UCT2 TaxID=2615208 RepID=UPI0016555493|nr:YdaS family helix-turn-helix protein [Paraburkholderia sp. UCT2]MBC8730016.1 helix-turn-helix domain-containing protein [Paraburkholderia sp. UCT2]